MKKIKYIYIIINVLLWGLLLYPVLNYYYPSLPVLSKPMETFPAGEDLDNAPYEQLIWTMLAIGIILWVITLVVLIIKRKPVKKWLGMLWYWILSMTINYATWKFFVTEYLKQF